MSLWRREDRAEAERNKELERLSKEMDEPGFWDRVSETLATASARDLARFADTSAPRSMPTGASLNDYIQRVRASTYPTPDC